MIERLLPSEVVPVEAFADVPGEVPFPGEEDLVARAVEGRRREFITTRRCAREALGHLGYPPAPIRPGARREPRWPAGVVGSLTHCAGYRAAAVAPAIVVAGLGIDAEPHSPLPEGVLEAVTTGEEPELLARLATNHSSIHWGRLLFSAKESVYKAWYPLTGRWLGFEDARLSIDPAAGAFTARVLVDAARPDGGRPLTKLCGRYGVGRGLVVTAVIVAA